MPSVYDIYFGLTGFSNDLMDSEYLDYMDSGLNGIKSPDFSGFDLLEIRNPSFVKRSQVDMDYWKRVPKYPQYDHGYMRYGRKR